jgi:macrolide-specific efflux system membrane fusion protein
MKHRNKVIILILICSAAAFVLFKLIPSGAEKPGDGTVVLVHPVRGDIQVFVATTGTIKPKNRLEILPTVAGRIEKVLVDEGNTVQLGQVVAWMSSSDRAALIDAARSQGAEAVRYWENVYKPIPVVSPITGTVIARDVQPGQTVSTSTVCLVISDRLEAVAQVDETDIAKIRIGQRAKISLDSHPDISVGGKVSSISYESTTVNNVTTYNVEVVPDSIPSVFRSGMSANINFEEKSRLGVMLIPNDAIQISGERHLVMLQSSPEAKPEPRDIVVGLSDEKMTEVVSGMSERDTVLVSKKKFIVPEKKEEKNMFMPTPPRGGRK